MRFNSRSHMTLCQIFILCFIARKFPQIPNISFIFIKYGYKGAHTPYVGHRHFTSKDIVKKHRKPYFTVLKSFPDLDWSVIGHSCML